MAALTMPTLIANYKKQVTVTRLKATYSLLSQAIGLSEVDNGDFAGWAWNTPETTGDSLFQQYILPYFKNIARENIGSLKQNAQFLELSGAPEGSLNIMNSAYGIAYILANGTAILTSNRNYNGQSTIDMVVDIDGIKKTNQWGKDLFLFRLDSQYGLVPAGYGEACTEECFGFNYDREKIKTGMANKYRYGCNKQSRGMWCAALIMADGWEIKDDYPY